MKSIWKGIAIAGIWLSASICTACLAWIIVNNKNQDGAFDTTGVWIFAIISTYWIKNKE